VYIGLVNTGIWSISLCLKTAIFHNSVHLLYLKLFNATLVAVSIHWFTRRRALNSGWTTATAASVVGHVWHRHILVLLCSEYGHGAAAKEKRNIFAILRISVEWAGDHFGLGLT